MVELQVFKIVVKLLEAIEALEELKALEVVEALLVEVLLLVTRVEIFKVVAKVEVRCLIDELLLQVGIVVLSSPGGGHLG